MTSINKPSDLPLFRMVYSSHIRYTTLHNHEVFHTLANQVTQNNKENQITGVLCFGNGFFLEYIEGTEEALTNLKNRLLQDGRHYDFQIYDFSQIKNRMFADQPMGFAVLEKRFHSSDSALIKYMPFQPTSWTLEKQLTFIQEVQNYGLLVKEFRLNQMDTLIFEMGLLVQLIKEGIGKDPVKVILAMLVFWIGLIITSLMAFQFYIFS